VTKSRGQRGICTRTHTLDHGLGLAAAGEVRGHPAAGRLIRDQAVPAVVTTSRAGRNCARARASLSSRVSAAPPGTAGPGSRCAAGAAQAMPNAAAAVVRKTRPVLRCCMAAAPLVQTRCAADALRARESQSRTTGTQPSLTSRDHQQNRDGNRDSVMRESRTRFSRKTRRRSDREDRTSRNG
jgi:hypothetical protein